MSQVYPVTEFMAERSFINNDQYLAMYQRSIDDPDAFWSEQADKFLDWDEKWSTVSTANIEAGEIASNLTGEIMTAVAVIKLENYVGRWPVIEPYFPLIEIVLIASSFNFLVAGIKAQFAVDLVTRFQVPPTLFVSASRFYSFAGKVPVSIQGTQTKWTIAVIDMSFY